MNFMGMKENCAVLEKLVFKALPKFFLCSNVYIDWDIEEGKHPTTCPFFVWIEYPTNCDWWNYFPWICLLEKFTVKPISVWRQTQICVW